MIPDHVRLLFWDTNPADFDPPAYPVYSIERVLEYGDEAAVAWLRRTFSDDQIVDVLRTDPHLTPLSANLWALLFGVDDREVAALAPDRQVQPVRR